MPRRWGAAAVYTSAPRNVQPRGRAWNATRRFDGAGFADLGELCSELAIRPRSAPANDATGVAIWFPRGPVSKVGGKLDCAKKTTWDTFLKACHKP